MANQKLNEVTTVPTASINNVKTFLAVMNDGSIQQMSKADMATVLGGLLSNQKLYPYMYRGVAGDIDTITDTGFYSIGASSTNLPDNAYSYGILEVFGGGSFIIQRYTPHNNYAGDYGEFTRVRYNDKWGEGVSFHINRRLKSLLFNLFFPNRRMYHLRSHCERITPHFLIQTIVFDCLVYN